MATAPNTTGISEVFRAQMPVTERWAYFDHAAVAPLPAPARQCIESWAAQAVAEGDTTWAAWAARVERLRETVAHMIAAGTDEIAFVPSTTAGISLVAEGFPWRAGDNVVTFSNEFPSNLFPWLNLADRGVETRRVPVENGIPDLDRLAAACDERTRIVTVSWIGFATGWRLDLEEVARIAHDCGAYFFLDAIQGLGVFPLDLSSTRVDFLAADGHKWMLGPEGAGVFFMRREHLNLLRPFGVGWNSVVNRGDYTHVEFNLRQEAARYEGGSPNMVGFHGLCASLHLLTSLGVGPRQSAVAERILEFTDVCCNRLAEIGARILTRRTPGHSSGIIVFNLPSKSPAEVRQRGLQQGVALSCRGGGLRISPHAYNDEADLERLMELLQGGR